MRYTSSDIQVKLEAAVLTACRQSLPLDNLEVDAIICVNVADRREEHVVKIHQRFDRCGGGAPNRNFVKVNVIPHNEFKNIVVDKVDFGNETDHKSLENGMVGILNVPFVQASHDISHDNLTPQKERGENIEVSNKVVTKSGGASKQKRKSSTPRCLRLKNIDNILGLVTNNNDNTPDDISESSSNHTNLSVKPLYIDDEAVNEKQVKLEENHRTESVINLSGEEKASAKDVSNMYIKIEPKADNEYTTFKENFPDQEQTSAEGKQPNIHFVNDNAHGPGNSAENDFTIEVNSDSESYDMTYNYTFDKSIDESLEENNQVNMKSFDDSDDQSLGSSPTDLTNSMMSYNVSHIMPSGTLGENNDILDVPKYKSRNYRGIYTSKGGGKWNDLKTEMQTGLPTSVEKLSCRTCGAIFSSTRTRRRHETSTCGATRFSCVVCSKLFSRKDARRRHIMRMHPIYWSQTSQAGRASGRIQA